MKGNEFYRLIQTIANYEEKFSRVTSHEDFDGGKFYNFCGYDIRSMRDAFRDVERLLNEVEIGVKL